MKENDDSIMYKFIHDCELDKFLRDFPCYRDDINNTIKNIGDKVEFLTSDGKFKAEKIYSNFVWYSGDDELTSRNDVLWLVSYRKEYENSDATNEQHKDS
jgi:hypothetical protein